MANSKFDPSLLKPIDANDDFRSKLQPVEDEEDAGEYLDNLPPPEGFFHKLPRNILIGLSNLGHATINKPHDIVALAQTRAKEISNNIEKVGPKILPKSASVDFASYIPQQENYDFAGMLGQKGDPTWMDSIIQKGIQYFPEAVTGGTLLRGGFRRLTGTHQLEEVEKAANQFGNKNFAYPPAIAKEAKRYLPKTEATKELFAKSAQGEYPASFGMKSQLGRHQSNLYNSPLPADRLLAPRVKELRENMMSHLENKLRESGLHVEADLLVNGTKNYAKYMRVKEAVMPIIKKLGIPTSLAAGILFGFQKGKKLFDE